MNNDIKQKALDHANGAVRNLRKNMALGQTVDVDGKEAFRVQSTMRAQQKSMLSLWEYIAAKLSMPEDPIIENVHYQNTVLCAENAQLKDDINLLNAKIELLMDRITQFKRDEEGYAKLRDLSRLQSQDPATRTDVYMRGYGNGVLLALSCFDGKPPVFYEAPEPAVEE